MIGASLRLPLFKELLGATKVTSNDIISWKAAFELANCARKKVCVRLLKQRISSFLSG